MTYLLFSGEDVYQPGGGVYDFQGRFESEDDARKFVRDNKHRWAHITDENLEVILEYRETCIRTVYPNRKNRGFHTFMVWSRG
jgi:hypothetical protein